MATPTWSEALPWRRPGAVVVAAECKAALGVAGAFGGCARWHGLGHGLLAREEGARRCDTAVSTVRLSKAVDLAVTRGRAFGLHIPLLGGVADEERVSRGVACKISRRGAWVAEAVSGFRRDFATRRCDTAALAMRFAAAVDLAITWRGALRLHVPLLGGVADQERVHEDVTCNLSNAGTRIADVARRLWGKPAIRRLRRRRGRRVAEREARVHAPSRRRIISESQRLARLALVASRHVLPIPQRLAHLDALGLSHAAQGPGPLTRLLGDFGSLGDDGEAGRFSVSSAYTGLAFTADFEQ